MTTPTESLRSPTFESGEEPTNIDMGPAMPRPKGQIEISQMGLFINSTLFQGLIGLFLASLFSLFAYRHLQAFISTYEWIYLVVCVSETLSAGFFIFRSSPVTVSMDPLDWFFALAGTLMPLFFIPSAWGLYPLAKNLIILGTGLQIMGLLSLNRSYALIAARRKIKTGGMYRLVRHPLYASYLILFTGYILVNTTLWNFVIFVMTMGFLFVRLIREEKHLALDPQYVEYMAGVRYRVLPFVF